MMMMVECRICFVCIEVLDYLREPNFVLNADGKLEKLKESRIVLMKGHQV